MLARPTRPDWKNFVFLTLAPFPFWNLLTSGVEFLRKDPYVIAVRERLAGKIVDITALKTTDFKTFWGILSHLAEIFESNVW